MATGNEEISGSLSILKNLYVGGDSTTKGNQTIEHDLKVNGWLFASNVIGAMKGLFADLASLEAAYPNPEPGVYAYVGDSLPAELWVSEGGVWKSTGTKGGGDIRIVVDNMGLFNIAIGTIRIEQIDNIGINNAIGGGFNIFRVMGGSTIETVVGLMGVISDNSRHQVTEIMITHHTIDERGNLELTAHSDTEVFNYYRSYGISSPNNPRGEWTPWKKLEPGLASETEAGLMSAADKVKLNGIAKEANKYELPRATSSALGGVRSTTTGKTANRDYNVEVNSDGTMKVNVPWTDKDTTYKEASETESGLMSATDKKKLNGIEEGAGNGNGLSADDKKKLDSIESINLIGVIDVEDLDGMGVSSKEAQEYALGMKQSLFIVKGSNKIVGFLRVISDEQLHQITQILTTHYDIDSSGNLKTNGHDDTAIFTYYRSYGITSPNNPRGEWTAWKEVNKLENASETEAGLMSAADKKKLNGLFYITVIKGISANGDISNLTHFTVYGIQGPSNTLYPNNSGIVFLDLIAERDHIFVPLSFLDYSGTYYYHFQVGREIYRIALMERIEVGNDLEVVKLT